MPVEHSMASPCKTYSDSHMSLMFSDWSPDLLHIHSLSIYSPVRAAGLAVNSAVLARAHTAASRDLENAAGRRLRPLCRPEYTPS